MKQIKILTILILGSIVNTTMSKEPLSQHIPTISNPFDYDLGIKFIPSKNNTEEILVCCHGYGHNNEIADVINSYNVSKNHIISFNFPDFNINESTDHTKAAYGTIDEVLPLIYLLHQLIIKLKLTKLNLYGFSAGGGAIVNALAILNTETFDYNLEAVGINKEAKALIIKALEKGQIILDCPMKSVEEIMEHRGKTPELEALAKNYIQNNLRPIDSIKWLKDLSLNLTLHFQENDEILGNSDDKTFINRLLNANKGSTKVIFGDNGGHNAFHKSLWEQLEQ